MLSTTRPARPARPAPGWWRSRAGVALGLASLLLVPVGVSPAVAQAEDGPADILATDVESSPVPAVLAASGDSLSFTGHGWGHGRGMGQYGSLGYALNHGWGYQQILGHYYGNTVAGSIGNPEISVELTAFTGASSIVITGSHLSVAGAPVATPAVQVFLEPDNRISVFAAGSCQGPLTAHLGVFPAGTRIGTETAATYESLVRACEPNGGERAYRGALTVQKHAGTGALTLFNIVDLEAYLQGVVPRESPASWGSLGGGKGMEALKAQSVAARSYSWASGARASGARTCDTDACQVYGGAARWPALAGGAVLEQANTNAAVAATAGQIRVFASNGAPARTEFSSSTGGWTVGGTFPAVQDLGDSVAQNPNHTWNDSFSTTQIAQRLGIPGPVRSVTVTGRNGLGDWGGRVTQVTVVDGAGTTRTYTGAAFRTAMGTGTFKSDWFTINGSTNQQAQAVVRALYQDVLGRQPDPVGLAGWTASVLATGNPQVVTNGIVYSKERLETLVAAEYQKALRRAPERDGLNNWVTYLERGAGVSDLQIGIYASQESLNVLGGGDTATWVSAMYSSILGRPASPGEAASWANVALTQGRVHAVTGIAKSAEAGRQRLDGYYRVYLGRGIDPTGVSTWLPYMNGAGDFQVPGFIGGSVEYWNRAQTRFP